MHLLIMRRLCFIFATVSPMFAGGGDSENEAENCFWTKLPMCKPSDQLPVSPCAKIETRSDGMATIRYLRKEDDVKMREVEGDDGIKQYCCESSSFWHNLDIWMKTDVYRQASESKEICEDQLVENQAFASRKVEDMNKQRFMGMCVWLVEKKKKHKGHKKMKELMMAKGVGSVCPVRFTMMSPIIDAESVGVCHYMLFNHPQRLFNSHKEVCGVTYTQLAESHVKNTDGLDASLQKKDTTAVTKVESHKCIFTPLDECTDDVPPLPCWIKPKAWPRKYKNAKMQEKIRATKFLTNKPDYRERNTDDEICCLRTSFWELLDKFAATTVYMKSKYREPCIDILKLDQLERPIADFASSQFNSFCVITHELNESPRHKARFISDVLRLRYDATCSMWSFKKEIANERVLCEFIKMKHHQADAATHWTKTHGDHCKVKEVDSEALKLGPELDKEKSVLSTPEKQPLNPNHHHQPRHHRQSPPHNPHHPPPHNPHLQQNPNHRHHHQGGHQNGQHQPHHPSANQHHHGHPPTQHHAPPPPPPRYHQPHQGQHHRGHQHGQQHHVNRIDDSQKYESY